MDCSDFTAENEIPHQPFHCDDDEDDEYCGPYDNAKPRDYLTLSTCYTKCQTVCHTTNNNDENDNEKDNGYCYNDNLLEATHLDTIQQQDYQYGCYWDLEWYQRTTTTSRGHYTRFGCTHDGHIKSFHYESLFDCLQRQPPLPPTARTINEHLIPFYSILDLIPSYHFEYFDQQEELLWETLFNKLLIPTTTTTNASSNTNNDSSSSSTTKDGIIHCGVEDMETGDLHNLNRPNHCLGLCELLYEQSNYKCQYTQSSFHNNEDCAIIESFTTTTTSAEEATLLSMKSNKHTPFLIVLSIAVVVLVGIGGVVVVYTKYIAANKTTKYGRITFMEDDTPTPNDDDENGCGGGGGRRNNNGSPNNNTPYGFLQMTELSSSSSPPPS